MTFQKPVKPMQQTSPKVELESKNTENFGNAESINFVVNNQAGVNQDIGSLLDIIESTVDPSSYIPYAVEISPADIASVNRAAFLTIDPLVVAGNPNLISLPQAFTASLSPGSGPYGSISTDTNGQQAVTVNVNIPDIDGIINYEVRLIKND